MSKIMSIQFMLMYFQKKKRCNFPFLACTMKDDFRNRKVYYENQNNKKKLKWKKNYIYTQFITFWTSNIKGTLSTSTDVLMLSAFNILQHLKDNALSL